jgi:hypothetical protein
MFSTSNVTFGISGLATRTFINGYETSIGTLQRSKKLPISLTSKSTIPEAILLLTLFQSLPLDRFRISCLWMRRWLL